MIEYTFWIDLKFERKNINSKLTVPVYYYYFLMNTIILQKKDKETI